MAEGLIVRDDLGVITECNAVAERLIGLSRDRLLGRHPDDVIGPAVDERGEPLTGGQLLGDRALTEQYVGCRRSWPVCPAGRHSGVGVGQLGPGARRRPAIAGIGDER